MKTLEATIEELEDKDLLIFIENIKECTNIWGLNAIEKIVEQYNNKGGIKEGEK